MLTKEEATKFLEIIKAYKFDNYSGDEIRHLITEHLNEFIEKPKEEKYSERLVFTIGGITYALPLEEIEKC